MAGKSILIAAEQGHGDTLQLVRYAELLKGRGAHTIVECQPPLVALLERCRGVDTVVPRGEPLPAHDFVVPLLSLPAIFNTALADVPSHVPYVSADPALVEHWRQRFAAERRFKVGIAWQGNPTYPSDRERSFPLSNLQSVAELPNVRLFSLQWGLGREQLAAPPLAGKIVDLGDELGDFHTTAAIVTNLDLVISCDSAPVHLAGALGCARLAPAHLLARLALDAPRRRQPLVSHRPPLSPAPKRPMARGLRPHHRRAGQLSR